MDESNILLYNAVGSEKNNDVKVDLFAFKCLFNQHYIAEVEHHPDNIYIVKFFQKGHKHSKNKYSLMNGSPQWMKKENAKNFLAIMNTIKKIVLERYYQDTSSSFGFIGAPSPKELGQNNKANQNADGTVANTKRLNIYKLYVSRYFSYKDFEHIEIATSSSYMLRNLKNNNLDKVKVERFFTNYFAVYC